MKVHVKHCCTTQHLLFCHYWAPAITVTRGEFPNLHRSSWNFLLSNLNGAQRHKDGRRVLNSFALISDEAPSLPGCIACCRSFLEDRSAALRTVLLSFYLLPSWKWKTATFNFPSFALVAADEVEYLSCWVGVYSQKRSDTSLVLLWRWEALLRVRKVGDAGS